MSQFHLSLGQNTKDVRVDVKLDFQFTVHRSSLPDVFVS